MRSHQSIQNDRWYMHLFVNPLLRFSRVCGRLQTTIPKVATSPVLVWPKLRRISRRDYLIFPDNVKSLSFYFLQQSPQTKLNHRIKHQGQMCHGIRIESVGFCQNPHKMETPRNPINSFILYLKRNSAQNCFQYPPFLLDSARESRNRRSRRPGRTSIFLMTRGP